MLRDKSEVDRHVYHVLAKCRTAKESNLRGFEIAKLYADIKEFKIAKKYLDGYLKTKNDSVPAFLLSARINESLDDVPESLQAYKCALKLSLSDKNVISHALSLALESNLSAAELEFWSGVAQSHFPKRKVAFMFKERLLTSKDADPQSLLAHLKSQLDVDQSDTDTCLRYLNCLLKSENSREAVCHSFRCLNQCSHSDSSTWFRFVWGMLETDCKKFKHDVADETIALSKLVCLMELLRTSSSTCCLSDMRTYLESLNASINQISSFHRNDFANLKCLAVCWIHFYTGVFAQRCLIEHENKTNSSLVRQMYSCVSVLVPPEVPQNLCGLSTMLWSHLCRYALINRIQAAYLSHQFSPNKLPENDVCSWRKVMGCLCEDLGFTKSTDYITPNSIDVVHITERPDASSLLETLNATVLDLDGLDLVLWVCAHEYGDQETDSDPTDLILSDVRVNFLSKFILDMFPHLKSHKSPYPFASESTPSDDNLNASRLCRTDVLCFLLACFLHMALRSLSKQMAKQGTLTKHDAGIGSDLISLPLCLVPTTLLSNSSQRSLWSAMISMAGQKSTEGREPPNVRKTLLPGLHQLRLLEHVSEQRFSTPFLFRLARALTSLSNPNAPKLNKQACWADGYWRAALHWQFADPLRIGHSTRLSVTGLADRNTSLHDSKGSPALAPTTHSPFALPSDYNLWLGLAPASIKPDQFYNWGFEFSLDHARKQFEQEGNKFKQSTKTQLANLLRLLDHEPPSIGRKVYEMAASLVDQVGQNFESWSQKDFAGYQGEIASLYVHSPGAGDRELARRYLAVAHDRADDPGQNRELQGNQINNPVHAMKSSKPILSPFLSKSTPKTNTLTTQEPKHKDNTSLVRSPFDKTPYIPSTPLRPGTTIGTSSPSVVVVTPTPLAIAPSARSKSQSDPHDELIPDPVVAYSDKQRQSVDEPRSDEMLQLQLRLVAQSQDLLMSTFMNNWQTLVNGLTCQLAETQAELSRSRQLNEQLSKQLSETTQKLSDAMTKFSEFSSHHPTAAKATNSQDLSGLIQATTNLISSPLHELSQSITELRRWLPDGMAAAAVAAVHARSIQMANLSPAKQTPFLPMMPLYGQPGGGGGAGGGFYGSQQQQQPGAVIPPPNARPFYQIPTQGPMMMMNNMVGLPDLKQLRPPVGPNLMDNPSAGDYCYQPDESRIPANLRMTGAFSNAMATSRDWTNPTQMYLGQPSAQVTQPPHDQIKPAESNHTEPSQSGLGRASAHLMKSPTSTGFFTGPAAGFGDQPVQPIGPSQQEPKVLLPTPKTSSDTTTPLFTIGQKPVFGVKDSDVMVPKSTPTKPSDGDKSVFKYGFSTPTTTATLAGLFNLKPTLSFSPSHQQQQQQQQQDAAKSSSAATTTMPTTSTAMSNLGSPTNRADDSDHLSESYEPNVSFKPVLDNLPELVDQKTGEENEERLFGERARLFRWDKPSDSWKTRGTGEVRILINPQTGKSRILMRRDQVKKLCLNHILVSNLKLSLHTKDQRISMWAAKDFSEEPEGKDELFMIQFKTPEIQTEFSRIFAECVSKSSSDTSNLDSSSHHTDDKTSTKKDLFTSYAPQPGDWECSVCLLQNKSTCTHCAACKSAKAAPTKGEKPTAPATKSSDPLMSKFAPKPGSWECPNCLLVHDSAVTKCPACSTLKPGTTETGSGAGSKPTTTSLFGSLNLGGGSGGFVFGHPKPGSVTPATSTQAQSTSTPSKPLFSFVASGLSTGGGHSPAAPTTGSNYIFGTPTLSTVTTTPTTSTTTTPFSFGLKPKSSETSSVASNLPQRPSDVIGQTPFTFNFSTSLSAKSSLGQGDNSPGGDAHGGDDDKVELVDDSKLSFKPVLEVMPEKVEVRTGEENDEVIFCQRAKLYRWDGSNWRERGVGELKLLKSTTTRLVRCLMRRDHVLKVCCNHVITVGMCLKPMTSTGASNAWSWWAVDFAPPQGTTSAEQTPDKKSDNQAEAAPRGGDQGAGVRETFAARFKSVEHAQLFRDLFEKAVREAEQRLKSAKSGSELNNVDLDQNDDDTDSDVVVIEKPLQVTKEQVSRARELKLPDEFYSFENGAISGESEQLTTTEEAEEDALLQAAIQNAANKSAKSTPDSKSQDCTDSDCKPSLFVKKDTASSAAAVASDTNQTPDRSNTVSTSSSTPFTTGIFGSFAKLGTPTTTVESSPSSNYIPQGRGLLDFSALNAVVSKDSKPLWGSGTTTGSTATPGWSTSSTPLFAKATTAKSKDDDSTNEGATGADDEHDPHYEPIITLPKLVETKSGEEEELCLFLGRCRVYRFHEQAWKERGVGEIKVLVRPRTMPTDIAAGPRDVVPPNVTLPEILRARLLMRRDQVLKLCVNQPIGPELPVFKPMGPSAGANSMCWVGEDYSEGSASHETLAIKFKLESDAQEFKNAVARAQNLLKS